MTDQFSRDRSAKLVTFYEAYRTVLDATPVGGKFMRYRWWTLPNPLNATWMAYSQMLDEYATELANIINDLTNHVHRLGERVRRPKRSSQTLVLADRA